MSFLSYLYDDHNSAHHCCPSSRFLHHKSNSHEYKQWYSCRQLLAMQDVAPNNVVVLKSNPTYKYIHTYIHAHIHTQTLYNVTWRVTRVETTQVICLTLTIAPVFKTYVQNGLTPPKVAVLRKWHTDTSKIINLKIVMHIQRCLPISRKLLISATVSTQTSLY